MHGGRVAAEDRARGWVMSHREREGREEKKRKGREREDMKSLIIMEQRLKLG